MRTIWLFFGAIVMCGCAHANAKTNATAGASTPAESEAPSEPLVPIGPIVPNASTPFDRGAAAGTLGEASLEIERCGGGADDLVGPGHAQIVFDPNGHPSEVIIDPPWDASSVKDCITSSFQRAKVPGFGGGSITVGKSFKVGVDRGDVLDADDEKALKKAVFAIDLASCNPADEEQPGVDHAFVVFAADGSVSKARVMGSFANGEAAACIGSKIQSSVRAKPYSRGGRWIDAPIRIASAPFRAPANP